MTLVLGQKFFQGIILIADSRASIVRNGKIVPWRDNALKIFRLYKHLFISFAGDVEFAGSTIEFLLRQIKQRPKIGNIHIFHRKGPKLLKYAYKCLSQEKGNRPLEFIVGGMDFTRPVKTFNKDGSLSNSSLAIFDKILFKFSCPDFSIEEATMMDPVLVMGSGESAIGKEEEKALKKMQFGSRADLSLAFEASIIGYGLKEKIKELGIDTVGGLFQMVTIDLNNGSMFHEYKTRSLDNSSDELDLELVIRNGRYIQRNLKTGKEIPLLTPPEVIRIKDPSSELFAGL